MKPILFNTDMVRAILDDRKTVTRRAIKTKNKKAKGFYAAKRSDDSIMGVYEIDENDIILSELKPPYEVGDILWVRETWSTHYTAESNGELVYCYKADGINLRSECLSGESNRWYPSIHMPKEAARLFLKVTDARVEKLRDMKLEDFIDEGITLTRDQLRNNNTALCAAREIFKELWNSTLGKKGTPEYYSNNYYANPYVWVIEFEVTDEPKE